VDASLVEKVVLLRPQMALLAVPPLVLGHCEPIVHILEDDSDTQKTSTVHVSFILFASSIIYERRDIFLVNIKLN